MKKEFSFGICTYNSEAFIIETLESIRFQVENYGKDYDTFLIISDDCSNDKTLKYIRSWIDLYSGIFKDTLIIINNKNEGISKNYVKLIKNIKTKLFKYIDGDDIFSSNNIYKQLDTLQNNMNIYLPISFDDEKDPFYKQNFINYAFYYSTNKYSANDFRKEFEVHTPFITPEACLNREYYDEGCLKFISNFSQFEDDPSLYYILRHNIVNYSYINEAMVLYRVHNKSLSNGEETSSSIKFIDDLHNLKKIMFKEERSLSTRLKLVIAILFTFRLKHRFSTKKSAYIKLINLKNIKITRINKKDNYFTNFIDKINNECANQKKHLVLISKNSKEFIEKYIV